MKANRLQDAYREEARDELRSYLSGSEGVTQLVTRLRAVAAQPHSHLHLSPDWSEGAKLLASLTAEVLEELFDGWKCKDGRASLEARRITDQERHELLHGTAFQSVD